MIASKMGPHIAAASTGLAVLATMVSGALMWLNNGSSTLSELLVVNALAACFAIVTWSGILWRSKGRDMGPDTWAEWLGLGSVGLPISLFCLWIDCGYQLPKFHPTMACEFQGGLSVVFTIGAVGVTAVSIPSAIRAWMLARLSRAS